MKNVFVIVTLATFVGLNCRRTAQVGDMHIGSAADLRGLEKKVHANATELANMCGEWPHSEHRIKQFMRSSGVPARYLNKNSRFIAALAGCHSYFELTDIDLKETFNKLSKALPKNPILHCISVGFLQPWLMLAELPCSTLSFLDINPHILKAQIQLYNTMITSKNNFDPIAFFRNNRFPFPVSRKTKALLHEQDLTPEEICAPPHTEYCIQSLRKAATRIESLQRIEFFRGSLADLSEINLSPDSSAVLYASNAIDEDFTTAAEFSDIWRGLTRLATELRPSFLVYHMGSAREFAIYQTGQSREVKTFCSDKFIVTPAPIKDPCYPKPIQRSPYEVLTWPDRNAGEKINGKNRYCLETGGVK